MPKIKPKSAVVDRDHNFIEEREVNVDDKALKQLGDVATRALALMAEIENAEEFLKEKKAELFELQSEDLPVLMLNAGSAKFTTIDGGWQLSRGTKVDGSIPKKEAARKAAIDTLDKIGAGDLIRTEVVVGFERTQRAEAKDIIDQLVKIGYEPSLVQNVHHQTLKAWARERLENGLNVPADKLGLWIGDWVDIKRS